MVLEEGKNRTGGLDDRWARLSSDSRGGEEGDLSLSVAARIRLWLDAAQSTAERSWRTRELLKALVPTAMDYGFDAACRDLSLKEDAPIILRVGKTVMIVVDEITLALSDVCERIRVCGLQPLVILDVRSGTCHDDGARTSGVERDIEVLDLEQFAATMAFKRAWQVPERTGEALAGIIATCELRDIEKLARGLPERIRRPPSIYPAAEDNSAMPMAAEKIAEYNPQIENEVSTA